MSPRRAGTSPSVDKGRRHGASGGRGSSQPAAAFNAMLLDRTGPPRVPANGDKGSGAQDHDAPAGPTSLLVLPFLLHSPGPRATSRSWSLCGQSLSSTINQGRGRGGGEMTMVSTVILYFVPSTPASLLSDSCPFSSSLFIQRSRSRRHRGAGQVRGVLQPRNVRGQGAGR